MLKTSFVDTVINIKDKIMNKKDVVPVFMKLTFKRSWLK